MIKSFRMIQFCTTVESIRNVIKIWSMRHLSLEGKIATSKSLAISKIVHFALLTILNKNIVEELNETSRKFLWSNKIM